jgi:predicted MPP superfamily phosphohydrolase
MTRLIILIVAAILLEVYFYKKYLNSIRFLFNTDLKKYKHLIRSVIIYLNIYLIIILGYWIWTLFEGLRFRLIIENNLWDYFILYPFWISIMLIIQVSLILLPIDLIKFVTGVIFSKKKEIIKKAACVVTFGVSTFFVFYVPVRVVIDYKFVETRIVEYRLDDSQKDLDGFKIAFIADVQADWYTNDSRLTNFIESINRTNPDLVLIAGDIITNTPNYISKSAEYLGKIKSKYGVYTCVGDHDNWAYRGNVFKSRNAVKQALASKDVTMLDNENLLLQIDSTEIGISFITESYSERVSNRLLDSLSQQVAKTDLSILLTHQPTDRIINRSVENGVDIMLAGHTHGGQITFLFPFINLTPTLLETTNVHGDFWYDDLLLIVNRGLGMSLVPIRYNSTPEVTLIRFTN